MDETLEIARQIAEALETAHEQGIVHRDGRTVILYAINSNTRADLMRFDMHTRQLTAIVQTPFDEQTPAVSPDERWIAYASDRSGQNEIYVESLSGGGPVWQVSAGGGELPQWRGDSRELFYVSAPDRIMSATCPGRRSRPRRQWSCFACPRR